MEEAERVPLSGKVNCRLQSDISNVISNALLGTIQSQSGFNGPLLESLSQMAPSQQLTLPERGTLSASSILLLQVL